MEFLKHDKQAWALCIVRMTLGSIFIAHGAQKVFGVFGGQGLEAFAAWLSSYGVPAFLAYGAAFAELVGGILLLTGICAELGALLVIPVMIGAVVLIHGKGGYFAQNQGFEYPLNLIFFSLAILVGGPGKLALFDWCNKRK